MISGQNNSINQQAEDDAAAKAKAKADSLAFGASTSAANNATTTDYSNTVNPAANIENNGAETTSPLIETPEYEVPDVTTNPYESIEDKYGVDVLGNMVGFADGTNEFYEQTKKHAMNDVASKNQEALMWGSAKSAANPDMTTGAANSLQAQMLSQQGANTATMLGTLGQAEADKMYEANKFLMNEEQEFEELHYDRAVEANDGWKNASTAMGERVKVLMSHPEVEGMTTEELNNYIANDADIQRIELELAGYDKTLGFTPTVSPIERAIRSYVGANQNQANINVGDAIGDHVNLGLTVEEAYADSNIVTEAALALGYTNAFDADGNMKDDVKQLIDNQYESQSLSPVTIGAKSAVEQFPEIWPDGWNSVSEEQKPLVNAWIREQADLKAFTVENGVMVWDDALRGDYPWENPDTMYGDWVTADGDSIVYGGTNGDVKGILNEDGDFVAYDDITYSYGDGEGEVLTAEEFDTYWSAMPLNMRIDFNKEDNITQDEMAQIMKFGTSYDVSTPASDTNPNPFYDIDSGELKTDDQSIADWFSYHDDGGVIYDEVSNVNGDGSSIQHDEGLFPDSMEIDGRPVGTPEDYENYFYYTGADNEYHAIERGDEEVKDMMYQASMIGNGGVPMEPNDLSDFLEGGEYTWNGSSFTREPSYAVASGEATPSEMTTFVIDAVEAGPGGLSPVQLETFKANPDAAAAYAAAAGDTIKGDIKPTGNAINENHRATLPTTTFEKGKVVVLGGVAYEVSSTIGNTTYEGYKSTARNGTDEHNGQSVELTPIDGGEPVQLWAVGPYDVTYNNGNHNVPDAKLSGKITIDKDGNIYNPYATE